MKKIFTLLALSVSLCASAKHPFVSTGLIITEVYGGGNNAGAQYKNDFVELYNAGATSVNLSGLSIQHAATGAASVAATYALPSFSLAPGKYYLIQFTLNTTGTAADLPTPDYTLPSARDLSASNGKIYLVNGTASIGTGCGAANIIDYVGFGTASCYETAAAPAGSNTLSITRNGFIDTDNNSVDFSTQAPNPRNSVSVVAFSSAGDINAVKSSNKTNLVWNLGCAADRCTYELQRSANGVAFNAIKSETVTAAQCAAPFSFTDAQPLSGVNYYRIKVTDLDGSFSYSKIVSVRFNGDESIKVIPTIAVNDVKVYYESAVSGNSSWVVYDMAGRAVIKSNVNLLKGQNTITINVSNLMKGQYQIIGNTESGKTEAVKIIKQ